MPTCKNCHKTISNYDKDICPYCGEKNPIESGYKTQDVTQFVDPLNCEYKLYKSKSKKKMAILMMTLGTFGVPYFYIGNYPKAFIELIISLLVIFGLGSIFFFSFLHNVLAFLIPFFALVLFYLLASIRIWKSDNLKDGNGEFLR